MVLDYKILLEDEQFAWHYISSCFDIHRDLRVSVIKNYYISALY